MTNQKCGDRKDQESPSLAYRMYIWWQTLHYKLDFYHFSKALAIPDSG